MATKAAKRPRKRKSKGELAADFLDRAASLTPPAEIPQRKRSALKKRRGARKK